MFEKDHPFRNSTYVVLALSTTQYGEFFVQVFGPESAAREFADLPYRSNADIEEMFCEEFDISIPCLVQYDSMAQFVTRYILVSNPYSMSSEAAKQLAHVYDGILNEPANAEMLIQKDIINTVTAAWFDDGGELHIEYGDSMEELVF